MQGNLAYISNFLQYNELDSLKINDTITILIKRKRFLLLTCLCIYLMGLLVCLNQQTPFEICN